MSSLTRPNDTEPAAARARAAFPALQSDLVYLENAGGSQVPRLVADRMHRYLLSSYVQLDADYPLSQVCTATVQDAHAFASRLMNGDEVGNVILGPSTTALCNMLGACYAERLEPGAEIVIAENGHEANLGPWARLERRGLTVRTWPADPDTGACRAESLRPLLNERTAIVAFPHVSNLLGEIVDVAAITAMAHDAGARVVVDGVAYAPHRPIDVKAWGVDWYVYSTYKVYGPHMAALFGTHDAIGELTGPNHYFIADDDVPYKFEPGGVSHEGCAGLLGLGDYLQHLTARPVDGSPDRETIVAAFDLMGSLEAPLVERLIGWLKARDDVRIVGPAHAEPSRVGTISFVHDPRPGRPASTSRGISTEVCQHDIGIRHGHMYAHRLCRKLGLDPEDGVVRISLVHYNTMEDIERVIDVLDRVLG